MKIRSLVLSWLATVLAVTANSQFCASFADTAAEKSNIPAPAPPRAPVVAPELAPPRSHLDSQSALPAPSPEPTQATTPSPAQDQSAAPPQTPLRWAVEEDSNTHDPVVKYGSRFRVRLTKPVSTETAQIGDQLEGELVDDLWARTFCLGMAGSKVAGHVKGVTKARRTIKSYVPGKHFMDAQGRLLLVIDRITRSDGTAIALQAVPAPAVPVDLKVKQKAQVLADKNGELAVHYASGKYLVLDGALGIASLAAGPAGLVAGTLLSGVAGSVSPNYAYGRPVEANESKSRTKGFLMGAGRGLPGGTFLAGTVTHGKDLILQDGDILTVELTDDVHVSEEHKAAWLGNN